MPVTDRPERCAKRLRDCVKGVAAIEFALVLPIIVLLALTGLELGNFVVTHHRVRQMAALTADNASRLRSQMSEAYINQLFVGVKKSGEGINFENRGRVILSSLQNNAAGNGQWIRWQRCFGKLTVPSAYGTEGKGRLDASLPSIEGLTAQPGSAIMYAEVAYDYTPLFPNSMWKGERLRHKVAFIVRQRQDFSIAGTGASRC